MSAALDCNVDLKYGFIIDHNRIRVVDGHITRYQINDFNQLIVGGHWITLSEKQREDVRALAESVHEVMPQMTLMAVDGVKLAVDTVQQVYIGLVGTDHKSYEKLTSALERVKKKVDKKFIHSGDNYYVGPGSLENVDELVDQQLEEEIEQAIDTSLGGILSAIAGLTSGSDADMERRVNELYERLELMGAHIERNIEPRTGSLRKKAQWFCERIESLNDIEERLRESIPQLQPYDAIVVGP
ncbi:YggN family protein [Alteromonas sp. a30]|uniref:YggN family protein n=1 Tax=Alteromonas sp. a30 TaxID=2730917 RepID=UPI002280F2EB|nr:YggN family protein [Alteromonas sp. a30]MCY7296015.1 YggN family protein [Alteromonas sp. a30]